MGLLIHIILYNTIITKLINNLSHTGVSTWHDPRVPKDLYLALSNNESSSAEEILGPFPTGMYNKRIIQ